jgi:NAD(P) transhydrogenase subunit beta
LAGIGMGLAILSALFTRELDVANNIYAWILGGMVVGGIAGGFAAKKVKMTDMPQMVSIFNGLGGACAVLLASVELFLMYKVYEETATTTVTNGQLAIILSTVLIGGITFTGSMLAFAKLQGLIWDNTFVLPKHNWINNILILGLVAFGIYLFILGGAAGTILGIIFLVLALLYGASFVIPIGGADMPVVISLLNSFQDFLRQQLV